jgi:hypothetical protein
VHAPSPTATRPGVRSAAGDSASAGGALSAGATGGKNGAGTGQKLTEYEEYLELMQVKSVEEGKLQRAAHERRQLGVERRQMAAEDDYLHELADVLCAAEAAEIRRLEAKLKHYWDTRYARPSTCYFNTCPARVTSILTTRIAIAVCLCRRTNLRELASTISQKMPDKSVASTSTKLK